MKKALREIGLALLVAGVLGMVIDAIVKQSVSGEFWIFLIAFVAGISAMLISKYFDSIVAFRSRTLSKFSLYLQVFSVVKPIDPFTILQTFKADDITTIRLVKMPRPASERRSWDMKSYPASYISPYILSVQGSPIMNGQKYLHVTCCFFNALPYPITLNKLAIRLLIGNTDQIQSKTQRLFEEPSSRELKKVRPLELHPQNPSEKQILIYFSEKLREKIKQYIEQKTGIAVCLQVKGFDKNGKEYNLETPQRKMVLLS